MTLYRARRRKNFIALGLCCLATLFSLVWLGLILFTLFYQGISGLNLAVFTQNTPPPGSSGGLLNAILGSLIMTALGVAAGTPLGLMAGTYLAQYGRGTSLAFIVRFINDILLSAPSIVIGLLVYEILVVALGHFSGLSGAVALAIIVVPIVVRTTEDMLLLVPESLAESGAALGMPQGLIITKVLYRTARAGLVTGILLAVARVSGETAPLLFTALNNQFFSFDLNAPMASLPAVIYQFALSPYRNWQALAWTGALLITLAVLTLSITARGLSRRKII